MFKVISRIPRGITRPSLRTMSQPSNTPASSSAPDLHPESLMMSYGYRPELSEGAIKCPVFQTSTYVFKSAEEGKAFFEVAYGLRERGKDEAEGLIYSRINHPGSEILEKRLTLWDGAEAASVFESGMAAITTTLLEFLKPGDVLLHSEQLYGGTDHFIRHVLPTFGIQTLAFEANATEDDVRKLVENAGVGAKLAMIYVETPSNPTNVLVDIEMCARIAKQYTTNGRKPVVAVDNTFLGPLWQHPLKLGADLVLYSATKYLGGHSDLIAGACLGSAALITRVKTMRTFLGTMAGPWTCWLLLRSMETLKLRMERQLETAKIVYKYLTQQSVITKVFYPGHDSNERDADVYARQCLAPGAMIAFTVTGGEPAAFKVLNALRLVKLAVSLGGTESLAEHPATMTHADVPIEVKERLEISGGLIRLSVGVEHPDDLITDLEQALATIRSA